MSHNTLENYYKTIFAMTQFHNFSVSEIENLIPFERDIFAEMIKQKLEKAKQG